MIVDDKKRVIGKIVSINSDRFTVELLSGLKNFNVNGYDDIHYFAQINSYVIVPYQNYYIVSEVVSVREKDTAFNSNNIKEQELNKVYSTKYLEVLPIGTITKEKFIFGASVYPTLYSDVLYIKDDELDLIFNVNNIVSKVCGDDKNTDDDHSKCPTRLNALTIGKSAIFQDYDIKIKIDNFFGGHSAILGNTGSGKSCTISSMMQTLFKKENFSAVGASFVFFDVNGEYKQAFEKLHEVNDDIDVYYTSIEDIDNPFTLPQHLMNVEEWELLLNASEKAQLPILRNALNIASLLSKSTDDENSAEIIDHIKSVCIDLIINGEGNDISKSSKITTILRAFSTTTFNLDTVNPAQATFNYTDSRRNTTNYPFSIKNCVHINFGEMLNIEGVKELINASSFIKDDIKLFESSVIEPFEFELLGQALELAILYEEAHGNNQIRNYCASLITRFKSLENREDFDFIKEKITITADEYVEKIFGVSESKKKTQVTIIDLNSAEDEIVEIVSSVLTRLVFDTLRKAVPRNKFPVNLVLEEAHRYIAYDSKRTFLRANQIFDRVAKEGRKYGLFFTISSQRPSELSKTVLSQCNNFIVHRIQNPDDLLHIRQITPHISETTLKKLPSIPTQHALIFGNAVNIPALFKVNNADPLPNSDNNEVSTNWFVSKGKKFILFPKESDE
ncbi:MAG: ATP-binding protein [Campylobacterales bacterium]|nr:ATP-binding protein [Campylobacterales bacterium]